MQVASLLAGDGQDLDQKQAAKSVCFELLLDEKSKTRARIPLRVLVNTHDTTESIITTVKSFYGIYDGYGVCFEDGAGNTLIASYDNFAHDTTVYVRSIAGQSSAPPATAHILQPVVNGQESPQRPGLGEPFQPIPPHMRDHSQSPTRRSAYRHIPKRSASPPRDRGRRSASQQQRGSHVDSRCSSAHGSYRDDGHSDSDAGQSSISGSKKARSEQFASSEISTANVLQDGRRGHNMFDSSVCQNCVPSRCSTNKLNRICLCSCLHRFLSQPRSHPFRPNADLFLTKVPHLSICRRPNFTI